MRIVRVSNRSITCDRPCRKCTKRTKPGEVVLHIEVKTAAFDQRHQIVHVECLQAMIDAAPPPNEKKAVERQVKELRDLMLATGSFFPSRERT